MVSVEFLLKGTQMSVIWTPRLGVYCLEFGTSHVGITWNGIGTLQSN